jgi:hypothetical protein
MSAKIQQVVLYQWKPGLSAEHIARHLKDIHSLKNKVQGLIDIQGGSRKESFIYPAGADVLYDHTITFTWADAKAYASWATHPEHARIGPILLPDLAKLISFVYEESGR